VFEADQLFEKAPENDLGKHVENKMAETNMEHNWSDQPPDLQIVFDLVRVFFEKLVHVLVWTKESGAAEHRRWRKLIWIRVNILNY